MTFAVIVIGALWFPHSLARVERLGYDFPIYYEYARTGYADGWYYAGWVGWCFKPLTAFPMEMAFTVWYGLGVLCWCGIVRAIWRQRDLVHLADEHPARIASWLLILFSVYPMLLCLELGQITPILSWLCLTPIGAVVACGVKPYCVVFVVFHIAALSRRSNSLKSLYKAKSGFRSGGLRSLAK